MKSWLFCAILGATALAASASGSSDELRQKAEAGDSESQLLLGIMANTRPPKDAVEAVKWFRKAAEQGNAEAQFRLGAHYSSGDGVPKDSTQAVRWYQKAAEQGNAAAQFNLALCYEDGRGVPKDINLAARMYLKAADHSFPPAQLNLGVLYQRGEGVPKDFVQAHVWMNLAAARGNVNARTYLLNLEQEMTPEQRAEAMKLAREKWAELEAKKK